MNNSHHHQTNINDNEDTLKLATRLRECAILVENNEFHPILYEVLSMLHDYAGRKQQQQSSSPISSAPRSTNSASSVPVSESSTNRGTTTTEQQSNGSKTLLSKQPFKIGNVIPSKNNENAKKGANASTDDWCEEHFIQGCMTCKNKQSTATSSSSGTVATTSNTAASLAQTVSNVANNVASNVASNASNVLHGSSNHNTNTNRKAKLSFQRPTKSNNSNLLATGWIEQQRRSKMRIVWKEVLASLVEGRTPKEETTLWIQRQITNSNTGKVELEALHQIPMKWVEDISNQTDVYGEHRFSIKVYNHNEEFHFKCSDFDSTMNWCNILKKAREATLFGKQIVFEENGDAVGEVKSVGSATTAQSTGTKISIKELRAIAHGVGIDTRGMERADLEKIAARYAPNSTQTASTPVNAATQKELEERMSQLNADRKLAEQLEAENKRLIEQQQHLQAEKSTKDKERQQQMEWKQREIIEERKRQEQKVEMELRRQQDEIERKRAAHAKVEEERKKRVEEERMADVARKRQQEEYMRRAQEEEMKRQQEVRRAQEEERKRQQEEIQRQKAEQIKQQRVEELSRQQEEIQRQKAEQLRWQQEQVRRQQDQMRQQQQQQQWNQQQQTWQQNQHYQQQQQYQQQPQPQQPPPQTNNKYSKAMSEEQTASAITAIKRNVLITWALLPPNLTSLRPIDQLLTNIHKVLPPAFSVPPHTYFNSFKPIPYSDLQISSAMTGCDENKIKKAVRKLKFFLHPDKLPKDLDEQQSFLCKMLWDVTSDAWEVHRTKKDELDWIQK